jgi:hypothetical protein
LEGSPEESADGVVPSGDCTAAGFGGGISCTGCTSTWVPRSISRGPSRSAAASVCTGNTILMSSSTILMSSSAILMSSSTILLSSSIILMGSSTILMNSNTIQKSSGTIIISSSIKDSRG